MAFATSLYHTAFLIIYFFFPALRRRSIWKSRARSLDNSCPAGYANVLPENFFDSVSGLGCAENKANTISIFIPHILPIAAPFILGYLKKKGFSGCRVEVHEEGLAVKAIR